MAKTNAVLEKGNPIATGAGEVIQLLEFQDGFVSRDGGVEARWCSTRHFDFELLNFRKRENFNKEDYLKYG